MQPGTINLQTWVRMKTGFLTLETHPDHNDLVRVCMQEKIPDLSRQEDAREIRYVARFKDIEAAQMHVQNMMHSSLVNLQYRIYRKSLAEMIACVEADELEHARVWMDPCISEVECNRIESLVKHHRNRHKLIDLIWQAVGIAGLIILLGAGLSL